MQRMVAAASGTGDASAPVSARPLSPAMAWRLEHFGIADATGLAANGADPDADGVVNLLEYALDADPLAEDSSALPNIAPQGDHLVLSFRRIADPELHYAVEATADLGIVPWPETIWNSTGAANVAGPVTVTDPVALSTAPRRFLRLRVE